MLLAVRLLTRRCPRRLAAIPARSFSLSRPWRAAEYPKIDPQMADALQKSSAFQKISQSQAALDAIKEFAAVMQNSGINIKAGEKPSTMQMLKLAANAEFRAASTKMMEEFKKAGVDVHDKNVMQEMQELAKTLGGTKSD